MSNAVLNDTTQQEENRINVAIFVTQQTFDSLSAFEHCKTFYLCNIFKIKRLLHTFSDSSSTEVEN